MSKSLEPPSSLSGNLVLEPKGFDITQYTMRRKPLVSRAQTNSLDWTWLLLNMKEPIESMFEVLLEIVDRQGYHEASHYVGIPADARSWCRCPVSDGHTETDIEIYLTICRCAKAIRSRISERENEEFAPRVSVVISQRRGICNNPVGCRCLASTDSRLLPRLSL